MAIYHRIRSNKIIAFDGHLEQARVEGADNVVLTLDTAKTADVRTVCDLISRLPGLKVQVFIPQERPKWNRQWTKAQAQGLKALADILGQREYKAYVYNADGPVVSIKAFGDHQRAIELLQLT